jgi:serine/threonine protein kinase
LLVYDNVSSQVLSTTPAHPSSLAERFWSLAKVSNFDSTDAVTVVRRVLEILDALEAGQEGGELSVATVSFLHMLRQSEIKGDLLYASPEQARGEQMDERSLVFSIGVLIFEKITGRHPFGAEENPRRIARIQKAEMASGVNYFQTISGPLRTILLRCMGPFPEERWSSMAELRAQLEAFARGDIRERRSRTLPALPEISQAGDIDEEAPTRLVSRRALTLAAEREVDRRFKSSLSLPGKPLSWMRRALWMSAGAAIAAAVAMGVMHRSNASSENATRVAKAAAAQPAADEMESRQKRTPSTRPQRATTAPSIASPSADSATPAASPPPPTKSATPKPGADIAEVKPLIFDPEEIGQRALTSAAKCLPAEIAADAQFGASIVFDATDGSARRVFLAHKGLAPDVRGCVRNALLALVAAAPPERPTTVSYSFSMRGSTPSFKAKIEAPR